MNPNMSELSLRLTGYSRRRIQTLKQSYDDHSATEKKAKESRNKKLLSAVIISGGLVVAASSTKSIEHSDHITNKTIENILFIGSAAAMFEVAGAAIEEYQRQFYQANKQRFVILALNELPFSGLPTPNWIASELQLTEEDNSAYLLKSE